MEMYVRQYRTNCLIFSNPNGMMVFADTSQNQKVEMKSMEQSYLMDTMFDLLNESDNLDVQELEEDEREGAFLLTVKDGTKVRIRCEIL